LCAKPLCSTWKVEQGSLAHYKFFEKEEVVTEKRSKKQEKSDQSFFQRLQRAEREKAAKKKKKRQKFLELGMELADLKLKETAASE